MRAQAPGPSPVREWLEGRLKRRDGAPARGAEPVVVERLEDAEREDEAVDEPHACAERDVEEVLAVEAEAEDGLQQPSAVDFGGNAREPSATTARLSA
jgi:hypothetical protein